MEEKTARPTLDEYFMQLAKAASSRATCRHRWQGAVIIRNKRVISMGYNGAPPGVKDCLELGYCSKERDLPCRADGLHGESNAIITAAKEGISVDGAVVYCIFSPCRSCCNMLKTVGIIEVVYEEVYDGFPTGPAYLESLGIKVRKLRRPSEPKLGELIAGLIADRCEDTAEGAVFFRTNADCIIDPIQETALFIARQILDLTKEFPDQVRK